MPTAKAHKSKMPGHTRLIDNPLFESTVKSSSHGRHPVAKTVKPKTPGNNRPMANLLFSPGVKPSSHTRVHAEVLVKAKRRPIFKALTKSPVAHNLKTETEKGSLNSLCYWLGSKLGTSKKTLLALKKS